MLVRSGRNIFLVMVEGHREDAEDYFAAVGAKVRLAAVPMVDMEAVAARRRDRLRAQGKVDATRFFAQMKPEELDRLRPVLAGLGVDARRNTSPTELKQAATRLSIKRKLLVFRIVSEDHQRVAEQLESLAFTATLTAAGMAPVYGNAVDVFSLFRDLWQGNYGDAALTAGTIVPGAGIGVGAGKAGRITKKVADATEDLAAIERRLAQQAEEFMKSRRSSTTSRPSPTPPVGGKPRLRRLHGNDTLLSGSNRASVEFHRKRSTDDIVASLRPGREESLKVKPDGTVMNGNTRLFVLEERGFDINSLPFEAYR